MICLKTLLRTPSWMPMCATNIELMHHVRDQGMGWCQSFTRASDSLRSRAADADIAVADINDYLKGMVELLVVLLVSRRH